MENLEILGVQQLSPDEIVKCEGGLLPILLVFAIDAMVLGFMGGAIYESYQ